MEKQKGGFTKNQILKRFSEEDIFSLVFKERPILDKLYTSPFRLDRNPKCFFQKIRNKLRFFDYANFRILGNTNINSVDCFDAIKLYYNIENFEDILDFIYDNLHNKIKITTKTENNNVTEIIKKTTIEFIQRDYTDFDIRYWNKYKITVENLIEDAVFSVGYYKIESRRQQKVISINTKNRELCFAYTKFFDINTFSFYENVVKLYLPGINKKKVFYTNCNENQIGGLECIDFSKNNLIITKSYKDWRVLKNHNINTIWLQNEGISIPGNVITILGRIFKYLYIFFDNDAAGKNAAFLLKELIKKQICKEAIIIEIPTDFLVKYNVKDISDMIYIMGEKNVSNFLKKIKDD